MPLNNFLNQRGNVKKIIATDGFNTGTEEVIYTDIPCYSYSPRGNDSLKLGTSKNDEYVNLRCIVEPDKILLDIGMIFEIVDPNLGSLGEYKILGKPKPNYFANNVLDSLQIELGK